MPVSPPREMNDIRPQSGVGFQLRKNQRLFVQDPCGQQVSDLFCFNADDLSESFSAARSMDYADTIFLKTGHALYSNRSNKMLSILTDTCGTHDLLMPPCSLRMFQIVAQNEHYHPSCHENLAKAFAEFNISPDFITTTFNIFMNVVVDPEGAVKISEPKSRPGDHIVFRAEQNLIVGLTACSHEQTNAGTCKPIHWQILEPIA